MVAIFFVQNLQIQKQRNGPNNLGLNSEFLHRSRYHGTHLFIADEIRNKMGRSRGLLEPKVRRSSEGKRSDNERENTYNLDKGLMIVI